MLKDSSQQVLGILVHCINICSYYSRITFKIPRRKPVMDLPLIIHNLVYNPSKAKKNQLIWQQKLAKSNCVAIYILYST